MPVSTHMRERAKASHKEPTLTERRLWNWLRNRTFDGHKFRRQVPIGRYVVDFYCAALKLAIEVDGKQHETAWISEHDGARTRALETRGIDVVRIGNELLARDSLTVDRIVEEAIAKRLAR